MTHTIMNNFQKLFVKVEWGVGKNLETLDIRDMFLVVTLNYLNFAFNIFYGV